MACDSGMDTDDLLARIERKPRVLGGKPVIKGTRLSVELIVDLLAAGESIGEILEEWTYIAREEVFACLAHASRSVAAVADMAHIVGVVTSDSIRIGSQ
jgi:uncharacterized protein (DUF433 family)